MRREDGSALEPIPVKRFRCKNCRQTYSRLPAFLCRYLRSLSRVVQMALEEYAAGLPPKNIPSTATGPAFATVWRWLQLLRCPAIRSHLEAEAPDSLELRETGRPLAQRVLGLAGAILQYCRSEQQPASLLQWSSLLLRPRYHRRRAPLASDF